MVYMSRESNTNTNYIISRGVIGLLLLLLSSLLLIFFKLTSLLALLLVLEMWQLAKSKMV